MRYLLLVPVLAVIAAGEMNWQIGSSTRQQLQLDRSTSGHELEVELITVMPVREPNGSPPFLEGSAVALIVGHSFNGGSFTGGFCGSLGALGGGNLNGEVIGASRHP